MKIILTVNDFIKKIEASLIAMAVLMLAALLISNVLGRVIFNQSLKFAEEVGKMLMMIITFAGLSYAARIARHINMTAIVDILPLKVRKIVYIIIHFITAAILFYFGYLGIIYVISLQSLGRVTPALEVPSWITFVILPVGFFVAGVQFLLSAVLNISHKEALYLGPDAVVEDRNATASRGN